MAYTQENKLIAIDTPLGKDELLLSRFSGSEGMSRLYEFELALFSENHAIDFKKIIGKEVTVRIKLREEKERYFHGLVSRFSQKSGDVKTGSEAPTFSHYTAIMVPFLWMLTQTADSRIFQNKSIPDVIEQIFKDQKVVNYEMNLAGSYEPKEYCVQYRETDFNFVSRLMEQEGMYYFFRHEEKKHVLVVSDSADGNLACPNQKEVKYQVDAFALEGEDKIFEMEMEQEIRVATYTVNDYNFKVPNSDLKAEVSTQQPLGSGKREIYDYPAEFTTIDEGDRLANLRIQEEEAQVTTISGSSRCRDFSSGHTFDLKNYYRSDMNDKPYVLTAVTHQATEPIDVGGSQGVADYRNQFTCIPLDVPFRPVRKTPKPVAEGTQPAIVVGPSGEEIYPDEFGRVKVQFIWDREGKKDENSSCWIRVSQQWAGPSWGAMFIPHIGHEVIVDFVEGDPDRPIIIGSVYNGNNKPGDALPENKTRSVIRSWGDNDIIIEDKEGDKHIQIKQANGNEIYLHESSPDIEIKQECGNKIHMKASGPDIEITQACGNEILMREAAGIQIRDKYGNEVVLDAAAGFMRMASPSHNSFIELGKSIQFQTDSNNRHLISGEAKFTVLGATNEFFGGAKGAQTIGLQTETFVGGKHETLVGGKITINKAREYTKNFADRDRASDGNIRYRTKKDLLMSGGDGTSELLVNKNQAYMHSKNNFVRIKPDGTLEINNTYGNGVLTIKSNNKIVIDTPQEIQIKGSKVTANKGEFVTKSIKSS
ncbi:type VI secretion system Vgr family protein [Desulfosarcina sp.]|uniref:type VI secretion system Vgr family protein n=1 Tax=Desulfosarcina sp. TaxID=2027861 RepID=UPI00397054F3